MSNTVDLMKGAVVCPRQYQEYARAEAAAQAAYWAWLREDSDHNFVALNLAENRLSVAYSAMLQAIEQTRR